MTWVGSALLLGLLASTSPAAAETPLEQAKALTKSGGIEFKVGHFEAALEAYSKAYQLVPTPALLFDIGQCHKMLGNYERAIFFFQGYLRDKPDTPNRPVVEQLIEESKHQLEAQRAQAAAEAQKKAEAEEQARKEAAQAAAPAPPPPEPPPPPPPPPKGNATLRITGLALAGAGVVALGTGTFFGLRANSDSSTISQLSAQRGTWTAASQSTYDEGQSSAHIATGLFIAGGVAVAAGAVLVYLGWPKASGEEARTTAVVVPAAGGGGALVMTGGF